MKEINFALCGIVGFNRKMAIDEKLGILRSGKIVIYIAIYKKHVAI